jgi:hypothetical protein
MDSDLGAHALFGLAILPVMSAIWHFRFGLRRERYRSNLPSSPFFVCIFGHIMAHIICWSPPFIWFYLGYAWMKSMGLTRLSPFEDHVPSALRDLADGYSILWFVGTATLSFIAVYRAHQYHLKELSESSSS